MSEEQVISNNEQDFYEELASDVKEKWTVFDDRIANAQAYSPHAPLGQIDDDFLDDFANELMSRDEATEEQKKMLFKPSLSAVKKSTSEEEREEVVQKIVEKLTPEQKVAALKTEGPVLVIAGAGAGKTNTLIHRVAVLMAKGVEPANIMVVTFTNKAAGEIKERLINMPAIGDLGESVTAGTFHSVVFKNMIKANMGSQYLESIGINTDQLSMLTDDESKRYFKQAMKEVDPETLRIIEENQGEEGNTKSKWEAKDFLSDLSKIRAEGLDYKDFRRTLNPTAKDFVKMTVLGNIWEKYTQTCRDKSGIDYDDVLVVAKNMLIAEPYFAKELARQYRYVHLDEYQDTNQVQMEIFDRIVQYHPNQANILCVGDEKQSIYAFRGSKVEIILSMKDRYPDIKMVEIKGNFRSSRQNIEMFNFVASTMTEKLSDGQLKPMIEHKEIAPVIAEFKNEKEEAFAICSSIKRDLAKGANPGDYAVLYRNRYLKEELEKQLASNNIEYNLLGDTSLYKRKEVKNAVAMIKFFVQTWNNTAGEELINASRLKLTSENASKKMDKNGIVNILDLLKHVSSERLTLKKKNEDLPPLTKLAEEAGPIVEMIKIINSAILERDDPRLIKRYITQFWNVYLRPKIKKETITANASVDDPVTENVAFIIDRFIDDLIDKKDPDEIIDDITLMFDRHEEEGDRKVQLMTMHASKGLEFKNVFLIGMEDGPDADTKYALNPKDRHEEHRLAYVAMTRAIEKLVMTYAKQRVVFGKLQERNPHFIVEELKDLNNRKIHKPTPQLKKDNDYKSGQYNKYKR
jgi:DNA helicase-2/ATP-dependent DNA helicase PcrA